MLQCSFLNQEEPDSLDFNADETLSGLSEWKAALNGEKEAYSYAGLIATSVKEPLSVCRLLMTWGFVDRNKQREIQP